MNFNCPVLLKVLLESTSQCCSLRLRWSQAPGTQYISVNGCAEKMQVDGATLIVSCPDNWILWHASSSRAFINVVHLLFRNVEIIREKVIKTLRGTHFLKVSVFQKFLWCVHHDISSLSVEVFFFIFINASCVIWGYVQNSWNHSQFAARGRRTRFNNALTLTKAPHHEKLLHKLLTQNWQVKQFSNARILGK